MDMVSQLQAHPLFKTFTPEALAEVVRAGTAVTYQPGDRCIRQGEAGDVFGVLISGKLEAFRSDASSGARRLGTIEPGECFGEMSMLTGNPTGADVVTVVESEAIIFLQEAISPLIALNRQALQFLTRLMARRMAPGRTTAVAAPASTLVHYSLGATSPSRILSISCRKHDLRYSYFDTTSERALAGGQLTGIGGNEGLHRHRGPKADRQRTLKPTTHKAAIAAVLKELTSQDDGELLGSVTDLTAIGHRVSHGGLRFSGPVVVDEEVKQEIARLASLDPMENPYNLLGIEICQELAESVPQVAVFDTSFYLKMPPEAWHYALPKDLASDEQLRRFGGHGISHEGAARAACVFLGINFDALKLVTCHLGTGASMTAMDHGRPVDNTMGFTPLSGLVMSTRPGDIDPGLLLYLIRHRGISPEELTERLYTDSGLLGLSGVSGDVQTVLEAADGGDPRSLLAIQVFCRQARKYLGSCISLLGGVDAIVFTGGVGEHAWGVRARICQNLDWMGIRLDEEPNRLASVGPGEVVKISQDGSRVRVLVVGSNEEHTIAHKTVRALARRRITNVIRRQHKPIPIGLSAHHVHLAQEHVETLFGPGHELTWHADLTQPGQFACKEQVSLLGPKARIDRIRVLGPVRPETQVEIARTEEFKLGIDAPIRISGDLDGSPGITLEGPKGQVAIPRGVICAMRHIHMTPQDAMEFAVRDRDVVRVRVAGERSLIFGDVVVRVHPNYQLDMHIDTDEANAAELSSGAVGYLDSIQERASAR